MREEKRLIFLIFLSLAVGVLGIYFSFFKDIRLFFYDLTSDYEAYIILDKKIHLKETFYFHVKAPQTYTMLYRFWKAPVSYREGIKPPFIKVLDVESLYDWYIKDYKGNVYSPEDIFKKKIKEKALKNEIGIITPYSFPAGKYKLSIFYTVYPVVHKNQKNNYINFKLADEHIPYDKIKIFIQDKNSIVERIIPHLPDFSIKEDKNRYIIKGKAVKGTVFIEILTKDFPFEGFIINEKNITEKIKEVNTSIGKYTKIFQNFYLLFIILFPFFIVVFYRVFGKEKFFTVPEVLSFVPNKKRKPYVVNLLFNGDSTKADENAFFSTLLDLQERDFVKIKNHDTDVQIEILNDKTDDIYEKKVINFLKSYTLPKTNIFSTSVIHWLLERYKAEKNIDMLKVLKNHLDSILSYKNETIHTEYIDTTGKKLFFVFSFIVWLVSAPTILFSLYNGFLIENVDLYPIFILSLTLSIQFLIVAFVPSQFFGRWKKDFYKEYLQWQGFKNFLSDFAMIKKYKPEDIKVWKDWLIYGTALGVSENVEKAFKLFKIDIPQIKTERSIRFSFNNIQSEISYTLGKLLAEKSTLNKFGGFGTGGGFGGGGAGGR